jgi:hypothetical protein
VNAPLSSTKQCHRNGTSVGPSNPIEKQPKCLMSAVSLAICELMHLSLQSYNTILQEHPVWRRYADIKAIDDAEILLGQMAAFEAVDFRVLELVNAKIKSRKTNSRSRSSVMPTPSAERRGSGGTAYTALDRAALRHEERNQAKIDSEKVQHDSLMSKFLLGKGKNIDLQQKEKDAGLVWQMIQSEMDQTHSPDVASSIAVNKDIKSRLQMFVEHTRVRWCYKDRRSTVTDARVNKGPTEAAVLKTVQQQKKAQISANMSRSVSGPMRFGGDMSATYGK